MNRLPVPAGIAIGRAFVAMVALFSVAIDATVVKAQDGELTWRQVEAFQTAFQNCMGQHGSDPSGCAGEAQRYWDALKRLRPGEGPVLTLPALPRETACDPSYWARKLGSTNAGSQQAATLAVQTILDLYHCHAPPTSRPQPVQTRSQNRACDPRFWAQQVEQTTPAGTSNAAKYLAVRKILELYGCIASAAPPPQSPGWSSSPTPACESGHWVSEVTGNGSIVILENESRWLVDPVGEVDSALWLPTDSIVVCNGMLIDTDDGSKVAARLIQ